MSVSTAAYLAAAVTARQRRQHAGQVFQPTQPVPAQITSSEFLSFQKHDWASDFTFGGDDRCRRRLFGCSRDFVAGLAWLAVR